MTHFTVSISICTEIPEVVSNREFPSVLCSDPNLFIKWVFSIKISVRILHNDVSKQYYLLYNHIRQECILFFYHIFVQAASVVHLPCGSYLLTTSISKVTIRTVTCHRCFCFLTGCTIFAENTVDWVCNAKADGSFLNTLNLICLNLI